MNTPTEAQLKSMRDFFNAPPSEFFFQNYKIIVEQLGNNYDYEILIQDPVKFQWHTWHSDEGFTDVESAIKAAEKWIENYDGPDDDYYAQ